MLKKIFISSFILLIFTSMFLMIYFVFLSKVDYDGTVQYIPNMIIPIFGFMLFFISIFILNKFFKLKIIFNILLSLFLVVIFLYTYSVIDKKYTYSLTHYYKTSGFSNLLHLKEYGQQKGNFIVLKSKLREYGFDNIYDIKEGYSSGGISDHIYNENIYLINNRYYILFNWLTEEIEDKYSVEELIDIVKEKDFFTFIDDFYYYPDGVKIKKGDKYEFIYFSDRDEFNKVHDYLEETYGNNEIIPVLRVDDYSIGNETMFYTEEEFETVNYKIVPVNSKITLTIEETW